MKKRAVTVQYIVPGDSSAVLVRYTKERIFHAVMVLSRPGGNDAVEIWYVRRTVVAARQETVQNVMILTSFKFS